MAYQALYRKYRPTKFSEVVGQKHILRTLKNAVSENRVMHAYLFSGPRGIGKTTIARIFARAVNCLNNNFGEPCEECANCRSISIEETTDIVELDAASNNGVEEIRSILEKVNFLPSKLNRKVYIIDEVHMLSGAAFNALLKTLEEPPVHVMFILATTEPYKIPATILSRCQRFDFKQIRNSEMVEQLRKIAELENINIEEDALISIAESAEGGMRDALSILDQVSIYNIDRITEQDVDNVTGKVADNEILNLISFLHKQNAVEALNLSEEILESGKETGSLINAIIKMCRSLLLYKNGALEENSKKIYSEQEFIELADNISESELFYYIDIMVNTQNKMRHANSQKIFLEIALLKIVDSALSDIDILKKISDLESKISNGSFRTGIDASSEGLISLENKIKRVANTLEKQDISNYKEYVNAKLNMLEEVAAKFSALPDDLNNRLEQLEEIQKESKVDNVLSNIDVNSIEEKLNQKIDELKNNNTSDIENLVKTTVLEEMSKQTSTENEEIKQTLSQTDTDQIMDLISNTNDNIYRIEEQLRKQFEEENEKNIKKELLDEKINGLKLELDSAVDSLENRIKEMPVINADEIKEQIEEIQKEVLEIKEAQVINVSKKVESPKEQIKIDVIEEPKKRVSPFEIDRDSVEFKTNHEIKEEKKEPVVVKKEEPKEIDQTSKIYDVKIVERILHQAREVANRERKPELLANWQHLDEKVGNLLAPIAALLKDGKMIANGTNELLIVYPNAGMCNQLMMPKVHENAKQILKIAFGKDYDFMALPENVWQEKRLEYHGQYSMGNRTPRLSPITNPELKIVVPVNTITTKKSETMQQAESLFGADLIEKEND